MINYNNIDVHRMRSEQASHQQVPNIQINLDDFQPSDVQNVHFTPFTEEEYLKHFIRVRDKLKTLLTLLLLSICSIAFGQPSQGITVTDDIRLEQLGLLKKIPLSKGELLTMQQHEQDLKQVEGVIKSFKLRDSVYVNMFLNNTISPYINQGDTLENWDKVGNEIHLKFKPKKK